MGFHFFFFGVMDKFRGDGIQHGVLEHGTVLFSLVMNSELESLISGEFHWIFGSDGINVPFF